MAPTPPTTPAMIGVFDDESDDVVPLFEGRVDVDGATLAGNVRLDPDTEDKDVEVTGD